MKKLFRRHRVREITADFDGGLELQKVRLLQEDLLGGSAELLNLRLWQLRVLPRLQILHLQQPPYDVVQQGRIHLLPSPSWSTFPPLFSKLLKTSNSQEKRNLYKKNSSTDRRNLVCSARGMDWKRRDSVLWSGCIWGTKMLVPFFLVFLVFFFS